MYNQKYNLLILTNFSVFGGIFRGQLKVYTLNIFKYYTSTTTSKFNPHSYEEKKSNGT